MKIKMSKQEARKITIIEELLAGRFFAETIIAERSNFHKYRFVLH